jgi:aspartyl-tRNA(Asn)/glutamyl-tRNA(Gln) amidotransferase subunit B
LIDDGLISGKIAKTVFARMYKEGKKASQIVQEENLIQISDQSILEDTIQRALMDNPEAVSEYKKGKKQTLGFLVGQVMKRSGGKANPTLVNKILIEKLEL